MRDGEWKTSWTIVRQTGIRVPRVPRPNRLHRVRFPRDFCRPSVEFSPLFGGKVKRDRSCLDVSFFFFFFSWLAKIDVGGSSPLLNFGTAMILGYSNRGSSEPCYQAFPKCPRDMNGLVHYLNNYNGGFFRLFNRIRGGKYRESNEIVGQRGKKRKIVIEQVSRSLEM